MLLSMKYNFIFIHIPKTGGTSIRQVLEEYSDDIRPHLTSSAKAMVANRQAAGLSVNPPHATLNTSANMLDVDLSEFIVICVVRNPVDRLVSYYKYLKHKNKEHRLHPLADSLSIDDFVEHFILDKGHDTQTQFSYFAPNRDLTVKGHAVLRYENLESDFAQMQTSFGMPSVRLPRLNQSSTEKVIMSNSHKQYLMDFEAQTVELMGYV